LKVCVVTTAFPRWQGDAQAVFVWEAIRAIARQGVDMRVVAMHSPGAATYEVMEGIPVYRPRYAWPETMEVLRKGGAGGLPVTWEQYPLARLQMVPFMAAHVAGVVRHAVGCDLVHAHWTLSAAAAIASRIWHGVPVLLTSQGSDLLRAPKAWLGRMFARSVLRHSDCVTVLSKALAEQALLLGASEDRLDVIPNGVDTRVFRPSDEKREPIVLYVGSLIERKGLRYLVAAFPAVLRHVPQARLVLIGEGPQRAELEKALDESGVRARVTWLPFMTQEKVRQWMRRARVLVLPSTEEGQGVVLLEAMACGTPVIGSRIGGIQDVITPQVGALVPPADPSALADSTVRLMRDMDRWDAASKAARRRAVQMYDWNQIAVRFVDLYESLVSASHVRANQG
jgi:glycosyltransferase involved in cell wall biosynthesis